MKIRVQRILFHNMELLYQILNLFFVLITMKVAETMPYDQPRVAGATTGILLNKLIPFTVFYLLRYQFTVFYYRFN